MVGLEGYMAREIKFRAWDNVMDRMYHVGDEEDIVFELTDGNFIAVDITEDEDEFATLHHLEYMQYTGLLDRHGREIYEGDIVSVHDEEEPLLVKFIEERAAFVLYNAFKYYHWNFDEYQSFEIEIIGNKFEDSEILGEFGK